MEFPADEPVSASPAPQPDIGWTGAVALALVLMNSLTLAAGGGYVFYASIRPVSIPMGFGTPLINLPWVAAALLILGAWLLGPAALLITGVIHLLRTARRRAAVAWAGTLAAGTAIGYVIWHGYRLLLTAYPKDFDGSALGPSRWAPGAPYWPALIATVGQCAAGVIMTALITAPARRQPRKEPPEERLKATGG